MDDINFIKSGNNKNVKKSSSKNEANFGWSKPAVGKEAIKKESSQPDSSPTVKLNTNQPIKTNFKRPSFWQTWSNGFFVKKEKPLDSAKPNIEKKAAPLVDQVGLTDKKIDLIKSDLKPTVPKNMENNYRQELKKEIEKRISQKDLGLNKITPTETPILHLSVKPGIFDRLTNLFHAKSSDKKQNYKIVNNADLSAATQKMKMPERGMIGQKAESVNNKNTDYLFQPPDLLNTSQPSTSPVKSSKIDPISKKWENPKIIETNLLADEMNLYVYKGEIITTILFFFLSAILVASLYGLLIYWQKDKETKKLTADTKMNEIDAQIKKSKTGIVEINNFKNKLKPAMDLLEAHIYWTNWFDFLESNLIKGSYISAFSGDTAGHYNINMTVGSYSQIGEALNMLRQNSLVKKAETSEGRLKSGDSRSGGVNFDLQLDVDPTIFYKPTIE